MERKFKVKLLDYTKNAEELLIFTKHTRRMDSDNPFAAVQSMTDEEKEQELSYILNTIPGPWEFINYAFIISGVTRAFTHQLVRHRVGFSFAQESLRIADLSDRFDYLTTGKADCSDYHTEMASIHSIYSNMVSRGIPTQDARGILPTNILTKIAVSTNLRSLNSLMNTRLCVRAQGEFQEVALEMRNLVLQVHPWAEPALLPFCMEWGTCKFPNFNKCPIKTKHPWLQKDQDLIEEAKITWDKVLGLCPQPK